MLSVNVMQNVGWLDRFQRIVRPRDLFVHDGSTLRRVKVTTGIQLGFASAALLLLAWTLFSAVQLIQGPSAPAPVVDITTNVDADPPDQRRIVYERCIYLRTVHIL